MGEHRTRETQNPGNIEPGEHRHAPNIPCLMHDTRLCQLDVKMTNSYNSQIKCGISNELIAI